MSINQQEIEENFINDIEDDNVENLKKYVDNIFHINSILRSRYKIWETNHLSILGKIYFEKTFSSKFIY
jgi:hypothetical protein